MGRALPSGTVTFLFTDVEGSTKLLHELGEVAYAAALAEHRRILREAFGAHGGVEVDTQGDAFFVAFATAPGALAAAVAAVDSLATGPIRVRMGVYTGTPHVGDEGYVGVDVHRAARIAAAGHGGQVLISASTAALLGTDGLLDLGEHRLKDLSAPERIYQRGEQYFPPLKSLYRTNLPIPATPFVGREHELAEVCGLLEDARLLTLTGPGGTGKTRLGLQAAAEVAERYADGIFWVPLAPLRDPELVLVTAGEVLGAREGLGEYLADKSLLLLFDNFEHVVEAAPGLSELLASCPNVHLLVTSRELLRVPGEQAYPVPPLEPEDGTELFVARARAALPSFVAGDAVPKLCARLENLPLALELAAARVRVLSPEQLVERLSQRLDLLRAGRGVDPRQQTLRATIGWSYELLNEDEQRLFARLAVFAGGCTLESAEAVCDADLDTLASLVDKSLVRVREVGRFWMLETIREYAAERLEDGGEAEMLRRSHAEHFLALGEEAEPNTRHLYSDETIERLEQEHDNLRAALDHLADLGENELVLQLAGALADFWNEGGHVAEGRRRLESALQGQERPTAARARALTGAALMAYGSGDIPAASSIAGQALELHRRLGDARGAAFNLNVLCVAAIEEGDLEQAEQLAEESLALFREAGDEREAVAATRTLAFTYHSRGDLDRARTLHESNLAQAQALGFKETEAGTLGSLAMLAFQQGRMEDALALGKQNLLVSRDLGSLHAIAQSLCRSASTFAVLAGKADTAVQLLSCFEALREQIGVSEAWVARMNEQTLSAIRARLDESAFAEAWEQGRALTIDEAVALALESVD
ncbi:MAG TPA: tetratricopeptide repeat protein [Gaiellaceae bacterium]|nr:tetratricopeptide repeat protein [Gaiellaceae bacterium]